MDPYSTHIPVLMAAIHNTAGPVIELGCGDYSTPALHLMCKDRLLVSAESDGNWLSRFADLESPSHRLFHVDDNEWSNFKPIDYSWDVAFVDQNPPHRKYSIPRLREKTRFIVIHDTESPAFELDPILATFKYRVDFKRYIPWTSIVSDSYPIDFM